MTAPQPGAVTITRRPAPSAPVPCIVRVYRTGPRCGQAETAAAEFIAAAECANALRRAENRERSRQYRGWQAYCRWAREESA